MAVVSLPEAKVLFGQDAEGFPSQEEFGAIITTVGVYQKCALSAEGIAFLPSPFSKALGLSLWRAQLRRNKGPVVPEAEHFYQL